MTEIKGLVETSRAMALLDKSKWADGPWQREPDLQAWKTKAGYPALVVRHAMMGNLCGYVFVNKVHPWHGVAYSSCAGEPVCDEDERWDCEHRPESKIEVHAGLTYSGDKMAPLGATIDVAPLWGFGFDCGHAFDYQPGMAAIVGDSLAKKLAQGIGGHAVEYRDLAYVMEQCESLAAQLKTVDPAWREVELDWPEGVALLPPSDQE